MCYGWFVQLMEYDFVMDDEIEFVQALPMAGTMTDEVRFSKRNSNNNFNNNNNNNNNKRATVCIPVPEAVSHSAAIQCCHFARQLSTKLGPLATNAIVFIVYT